MSSACRLNLSGKGTCKLTQLIVKQNKQIKFCYMQSKN